MAEDQKEAVRRQFAASVGGYVTSSVHAHGDDLARLPTLARLTGVERVLDVATAVGHTAFTLAPFAAWVTGVDLTAEMLDEARRQAAARGLANLSFQLADAERLPFPNASFEVVACRIAAHHFPDVPAFCREAARVLTPGGRLLVVDNIAPADDELDWFINAVEQLRDPSHVRAYRLSEWAGFVEQAGLRFEVAYQFASPLDREDWLRRMHVSPSVAQEVRTRMLQAPSGVKEAFGITETQFILQKAVMVGCKA